VLLRGLPAEARLGRVAGDEVVWTTDTEILACLLEEVSVLSADRRRRQPLQIGRPVTIQRASDARGAGKNRARGVTGLMSVASGAGRVRA
jgi:hypothetical protein